ncbi:MAG: TonB-dependent receptor [Gammaproteobacteria bacterium]|nr:TonB-dependent receptor [Gammaproteobacteria bacterium]MDE0413123.1 TonB-dependent receptor [Gammaproteobacteria bacterium]
MQTRIKSPWAAGLLLAFAAPMLGLAQDADEDSVAQEQEASEDAIELTPQIVTGTRMIGGDPSAKVFSFSAEEMSRRGISSLEDLFRTLPYAFPSITTQSNMLFGGGAQDTDTNLGALGLGVSTVNLRALGSANTLVLVDGRKVAGSAGNQSNFANILHVPLAAIERVDIQLDGASAVYGGDAIGGVVNFILRKDFRGLTATARNEWSNTDADRNKFSIVGGFSWDTGNVTATASVTNDEPVNNLKIWTTNDFRDQYGPEFDKRVTTSYNQPGIVCEHNGSWTFPGCRWPYTYLQLPSGSGVGATPEDFTTDIKPFDFVPPQNGEDSTRESLQLNAEQYLTDNIRIYASALISDVESRQEFLSLMSSYVVPASNAYNPFGRNVVVNYYPLRELQEGRIPWSYTETESKQRNYSAGMYWEIGAKHQVQLDVTRSESENFGWQIRTDWRRSRWDPSAETFYRALESSDPNVALNLFGDGTAQGSAFEDLFTNALGPSLGFTDKTIVKPLVRGELFEIWGGPVRYVIGGERESTKTYSHSTLWGADGPERAYGREDFEGVEQPEVKNTAWFAEIGLPLVTAENARPGLHALQLSLQVRKDSYEYEGASGGVVDVREPAPRTAWIPGQGWTDTPYFRWVPTGDPNLIVEKRTDTTYRTGIYYQPAPELTARLSWQGAFKPPTPSTLFGVNGPRTFPGYYIDPYHPDGETGYIRPPTIYSSFNPDIHSQTSDTYRVVLDWTPANVPGLTLSVDWSQTEFKDKIEFSSTVLSSEPELAFSLPSLVERDANGYITQINVSSLNLSEKVSELLTVYAEYAFQTRIGAINPRLTYTRVMDEYYTVVAGSEPVDRVGTVKGLNEYTWQGSVTLIRGPFAADLFLKYIPSYENDRAGYCFTVVGRCERLYQTLPTLTADSLTTVDLTLTWQFNNGLRVRGGARNIFDERAITPLENLPYDPTRWNARARILFLEFQYELGNEM